MSAARVCGWLAGKGGERGCERGRAGRLLEAIDIMMMENKMLKEKERSNIGWTSAADFQPKWLIPSPSDQKEKNILLVPEKSNVADLRVRLLFKRYLRYESLFWPVFSV